MAVPHTCGISVSLATFSVSVMDVLALLSRFITYNLFTIEVWPLCLFIALNNSLAINMIQKRCFATRLKCSNNLLNSKMNYEDNHSVNTQYSKPFTMFSYVSKLIIS